MWRISGDAAAAWVRSDVFRGPEVVLPPIAIAEPTSSVKKIKKDKTKRKPSGELVAGWRTITIARAAGTLLQNSVSFLALFPDEPSFSPSQPTTCT